MQYFFGQHEVWRKLPGGGWVELAQRSVSFNGMSVVDENEVWFTSGGALIDRYIHGSGFTTWGMESVLSFPVIEFRQILLHAYSSNEVVAVGIDGSSKIFVSRYNGSVWSDTETQINHSHGNLLGAIFADGDNLYFALGDPNFGNRQRLYKHTNRGIGGGWTEIGASGTGWGTNTRVPNGIWVNPGDPDEIWVCWGRPSANGIDVSRTTDGGANWTNYTRGDATYGCASIYGDPQGNVWVGHNQDDLVSIWNGTTLGWEADESTGSGGFTGYWWGPGAEQGHQRLLEDTLTFTAPRLEGLNPKQHEGAVKPDTKVNLTVIDDEGTLDDASVIITVNGVIAWSSDAQQNSFVVAKTPITNGNQYEVTPPANLPDGPAAIRVQADDGVNTLDRLYHFFVNRIGLLDDHFGGVGVNVQPGNGTISAANGRLKIEATAGQNLDWWTFGRNGTIGLVPITNLIKDHSILYFETTLHSWTTTNSGHSHSMWGIYLNDQNFYWIYTHDEVNWNAYKTVGNGWTFMGSYSGNPVPGAPPARIRFKWDRTTKLISWQVYDSGWQDIVASEVIGFTPTDVFFGQKNYSSLPAITSEYEELLIYAEDEAHIGPDDVAEVAQLHDAAEFNPQEDAAKRGGEHYLVGPTKHNAEFSIGSRIPGPPQQQVGSVGPFDVTVLSDKESYPELVEGRHRGGVASVGVKLGGLNDQQRLGFLRAGLQDEETTLLGIAGTYSDITVDGDFNAHFTEKRIKGAFFYNTAGEDWANPVTSLLTGYARNGTRYTAGVQDGGPVNAPWAAEAFSTTRGNRNDFPEEALIVWTDNSLVIFDVTNFPADLTMWMRFTVDTQKILRETITDVKMVNGVLIVSHTTGTSRLILVDFKGDTTANTGHLIGPDNHWRWNGDIAARNGASLYTTAGVSPSLRINSENNYDLAARKEGSKYYAAISGEDDTHVIEVDGSQGTVPSRSFGTAESNRPANIGDIRNVTFDDFGWLWTSEQKLLVRNATQWRDGCRMLETRDRPAARGISDLYPVVELPYDIDYLVSARDYVYCGTEVGIYRVKRGTLKIELAYTVVGGGGGGRLNNPPDGELLLGDTPQVLWLHAYSLDGSSYLAVTTYQGVVTIRLFDDVVTQGLVYPALFEHRAYFNTSVVS
jgi:hypothetical protein